MAMQILSIIILIGFSGIKGQLDNVCNESDYNPLPDDPPLPKLPNQYYFAVEAVLGSGRTIFAEEYFDDVGNRGRFDFTSMGSTVKTISDFNLKETFVIPNVFTGDDCTVSILSTNSSDRTAQILFGIVPGDNNTVHIGSPSTVFYPFFVNQTKAKYFGVVNETSRGIRAHQWQVCANRDNRSYTIDYYFTNASLWTTPYQEQGPVPVAIVLSGWRLNGTEVVDIYHYYSFVNYRSGPRAVEDDVFAIPFGLVCKGRVRGQLLPQFPAFFSTSLQQTTETNTVMVRNAREYYDFTHSLLRIDTYNQDGPITIIHDFNVDVQYTSNSVYGTCKADPISPANSLFDGSIDDDGQYILKDSRHLFFLDKYDFVYEGVKNDGLLLDAWIGYQNGSIMFSNVTITNSVYEIFMTRPGQVIQSTHGISVDPSPWQMKFSGAFTYMFPNKTVIERNFTQSTSFYDFSSTEPPYDAFTVLSCFNVTDYVVLVFRLPGNVNGVDQSRFRTIIRAALVDYAKSVEKPFVTPLQISAIQVTSINLEELVISVHINDINENSNIPGNYSARSFVNELTEGLEMGDNLPFVIPFSGTNVSPILVNVVVNNSALLSSSSCAECSCFPIGATVGISIATFVLGIISGLVAGIVVCMCCTKKGASVNLPDVRSSADTVRYERQIDDHDDAVNSPSSAD